ncbi:MAG: aminodeoxychorismate/anthranilate synthase component II [Bacteroidia bacterium]|nr:aminodeoxychorismate/anthranilate synthase component II [Bacteroidia bacterium]
MLLLIDNYDSFTFNLRDYFLQLGQEVLVVKNDQINSDTIQTLDFDKVVISPGPNTPDESGNLMQVLPQLVGKFPILGICLGHQALGQYFGAELLLAQKPMHGKVSYIEHTGKGIYKGLPNTFEVCRYHSLILKLSNSPSLVTTAYTKEGECMGFDHVRLPISGMQYHPEAILTQFGLKLLKNWLDTIA